MAIEVKEEEGTEVDPLVSGEASSLLSGPSGATGFEETPTVDELVLRHLRPRLRGFHGAVDDVPVVGVRDDPAAASPLDLLAWHGGAADRRRGEAFYFARRSRSHSRSRSRRNQNVQRTVPGGGAAGLWKHSRTSFGKSVTDLGVVVPWSETLYYFYRRDEGGRLSTSGEGWGLAEYEITESSTYRRAGEEEEDDYWVICHVRKTAAGKKRKRRDSDEAVAAGVADVRN